MPVNGATKTNIARAWRGMKRLRGAPPRLTILYYHAVPQADAANFARQMAWLAEQANVVAADHEGPLDPKRANVAITFDDAFATVAEFGLAALAQHKLTATIFVPSGWLGKTPGWQMETDADGAERVMDATELLALPCETIRFGSHSVDHPRMSHLGLDEREAQYVQSRDQLQAALGVTIDTLAFPYGDHDPALVDLARRLGYRYVYSILPEGVRADTDQVCRGRTAVDAGDSLALFILKAQGAFDWLPVAIRAKQMLHGLLRR
jgi:peptidoglycan/xylan/chitin deacetylase (PgdA/CDA1 family)